MRVIGTAGHVDHGKSTLVKALTGTHPDRLKEEIEREMTIELGFAWFNLPNGEEIGIVDVPGHRDFIENMLAGVGGIDAALLIIAADEGIMPQTREHLAIIDLLQINAGIIVLTKTDLIDDSEWLDLVELDIRDILKNTSLENAPIIRTSSLTGFGMDTLLLEISNLLTKKERKEDFGRARLPIDRVFSVTGFGTVVTGTLLDGFVQIGDEVTIFPKLIKARVRGIQTHKNKSDKAGPGTRTALNLSGVEVNNINRGDVVALSGKYSMTQRFDAYVRILPDSSLPLKHNQEVKIFVGSSEMISRVRILGSDVINAGTSGWTQFEMKTPMVLSRKDRFIIRRPSPGETIGGGEIVNPFPGKRYKRFSSSIINQLEAYLKGTPEEIFLQVSLDLEVANFSDIVKKARIETDVAEKLLPSMIEKGKIILIEMNNEKVGLSVLGSGKWYSEILENTKSILYKYHNQFPLRNGMPREELKSKLKVSQKIFLSLIQKWDNEKQIKDGKSFLALHNHEVKFSKVDQLKVNDLIKIFLENPYSPPGVVECRNLVGDEVLNALIEKELVVQVMGDILFLSENYQEMLDYVLDKINSEGEITVAQFRDKFHTSRKYALGFLEYLDSTGITYRDGDFRKFKQMKR